MPRYVGERRARKPQGAGQQLVVQDAFLLQPSQHGFSHFYQRQTGKLGIEIVLCLHEIIGAYVLARIDDLLRDLISARDHDHQHTGAAERHEFDPLKDCRRVVAQDEADVPRGTRHQMRRAREQVVDHWRTVRLFSETRLDFGPVPGLGSLSVRLVPKPGFALWLVRGDVRAVGNPPMELLRASWAQLVYQPHGDRITLGALAPGRYTLIWASFHAAVPGGPLIVPVTVPSSGEVTLVQ